MLLLGLSSSTFKLRVRSTCVGLTSNEETGYPIAEQLTLHMYAHVLSWVHPFQFSTYKQLCISSHLGLVFLGMYGAVASAVLCSGNCSLQYQIGGSNPPCFSFIFESMKQRKMQFFRRRVDIAMIYITEVVTMGSMTAGNVVAVSIGIGYIRG